ncbi:PAS domain-containing protein [Neorhodopirellula pilleata]|uniref:histidine kinase n=1 Tax=Neorhodopirellula pilleata TaxID=2714738 RepID=A0A5C6ANZ8_9BACT|nr:PAS domain-containing protein [Neorhodopirellula pilleata]TWU01723.1 Autoinducer 2 sensor kinase/phosphatase LuxQ [Neorhodopirellula pilleata]
MSDMQRSSEKLAAESERELSETRGQFDRLTQDYEAAIEQVKSANEELTSLNEQKRLANVELETSKEEVQSLAAALERTNSDLDNLLRSTQIATIFLDGDFNIRRFSSAATSIYGLVSTDIGLPLNGLTSMVADMPPLPERESLQVHQPIEHRVRSRDARIYIRRVVPYHDQSGNLDGAVVTFTDITNQELAQMQVEASQRQLQTFADAIPRSIAIVDTQETFLFANQACCDRWQRGVDKFVGHQIKDVVSTEAYEEIKPKIAEAFKGKRVTFELKLKRPSEGRPIYEEVHYVPQVGPGGTVEAVLVIITDITIRKRRELNFAMIAELQVALIPLHSVEELQQIACQRVAEYMQASRCCFLQVDEDGQHLHVTHDYSRGKIASILGRYKLTDYHTDEEQHAFQSGKPVVICDVRSQVSADRRPRFGALQVEAVCNVSFRRENNVHYVLATQMDHPHDWTDDEILLLQNVIDQLGVRIERAEAVLELSNAKQQMDLALEISRVASWTWDFDANKPNHNSNLNRLFGFDPDTLPSLSEFVDRMDADHRGRVTAAIEQALTYGGTYDEEYPIHLPGGEVRWVHAIGRGSGPGKSPRQFLGVVTDVTERKRREIELSDRESHLRRVINNQLGLVGVIDKNGILLEVDDRSLAIAKTRREDVVGKHFADAPWWSYDPKVAKGMRDAMDRAMMGEIVRYDLSLFSHGDDGVLIDFMIAPVTNEAGEVEYLIPSGVDIRERAAYERSLKETSRRMEMAMRAGRMAAWEWTPQESVWTEQLYNLLGIDSDQEPCNELFFSIVHPEDIDNLKSDWQSAVDGTDSYDVEFRIVRSDGQVRWISGMGEVVRSHSGKVVKMYGVNWDSTSEHEQAAALRESEKRAQAASASKSAFLANMSHEIRTPMTAILGYTDLLQEFVLAAEAKQHLQTIRHNGNYLLEIINDILDLSKIEAGKFEVERERFDPVRVIEDVRSVMDVRARESGLTLTVQYDGKLPLVIESDAKRLKQILINLVGNAIKFTHEGRVNVRARFDSETKTLCFDVIDTGIGMTQQQLDRLFKPFSQGDSSVSRRFGGTGLGLAISQKLAELLGGEIVASSTLEVGSTFTVTLQTGDIADQLLVDYSSGEIKRESSSAESKTAVDAVHNLNCRILVVDDRRDIRFLSKHILTKAGATVVECEDGQIAVDYVAGVLETSERPDLILLDMQMPNLDGYQAARKLRELGYTGPIIALTADAMQGDMTACLKAGCNDYLSKPIDQAAMLQKIARMIS